MTNHPVRRRYLINELRRLRAESGMSADQVAAEMSWERTKVYRIENGKTQGVKAADVRALCALFDVAKDETEALVEVAKKSRQRGWWQKYSDVLPGAYPGLEAEASYIRTYECVAIPGLLQTREYAAAVIRASGVLDEDEVQRRIEARFARQSVLSRTSPPSVWAIIDEGAVTRLVGGASVMAEQLTRLVEASQLDGINIQILPLVKGAHAAMNGHFVILDFPAAAQVVFIESDTDGLYLESNTELERYNLAFNLIQAGALSVEESLRYLRDACSRLAE